MLNIRLSRVGKKGDAQYRVVVAEKSAPIKGKSVEQLGSYNPHNKIFIVKKDRIKYWISKGAACSDTVYNLLIDNNVIEGDKRTLSFKSKKKEVEKDDNKEKPKDDDKEDKAEENLAEKENKEELDAEKEIKDEKKSEDKK